MMKPIGIWLTWASSLYREAGESFSLSVWRLFLAHHPDIVKDDGLFSRLDALKVKNKRRPRPRW